MLTPEREKEIRQTVSLVYPGVIQELLHEVDCLREQLSKERDQLVELLKKHHELKKNIESALKAFALNPDTPCTPNLNQLLQTLGRCTGFY